MSPPMLPPIHFSANPITDTPITAEEFEKRWKGIIEEFKQRGGKSFHFKKLANMNIYSLRSALHEVIKPVN